MTRICAITRSSTARRRSRTCCGVEAGILFIEHVAEDGPTVFAHAYRLGAEGIVSKRDGTYRSGRCPAWMADVRDHGLLSKNVRHIDISATMKLPVADHRYISGRIRPDRITKAHEP
jgi:hypothetical protein